MQDPKLELKPKEAYALLRDDGKAPHEALGNVIPIRRRLFTRPKGDGAA